MTVTFGTVLLFGLHLSPMSAGSAWSQPAWLQAGSDATPTVASVDEPHDYRYSVIETEPESEDDSEAFRHGRVCAPLFRQLYAHASFSKRELSLPTRATESSHAARAPPAFA